MVNNILVITGGCSG